MSLAVRVARDDADLDAFGAVVCEGFGIDAAYFALFRSRHATEDFFLLVDGEEVVGGAVLYRCAMRLGGRAVPVDGPAIVAVRPDRRGQGAAARLMEALLAEARRRGVPLSALYPAGWPIYRKGGWELAGACQEYVAPLAALPAVERGLPCRPLAPLANAGDRHLCERLHAAWIADAAGALVRDRALWDRVFRPRGLPTWAYALGAPGEEEGYVVLRHDAEGSAKLYDLVVTDLVTLTPRALARAWTLFADHRSVAESVRWRGPASDPRAWTLPDLGWRHGEADRWMLRVVDVPGALAARGWPAGVTEHLEIEVSDPVLPANAGRWAVAIAGGRAEVRPGGEGRLRLGVRALAPLYTGLHRAGELAALGWIEGDAAAIAAADRAFAGPPPWMADPF